MKSSNYYNVKYISILFSLIFLKSFSQSDTIKSYVAPHYKGGRQALYQYLSKNLDYPTMDQETKNEMNVTATIYVTKAGRIKFVSVLGGSNDARKDVKRVISLMPDWIAGTLKGVSIDTAVTQKIYFSLDKTRVKNDTLIFEIVSYKVRMSEKESDEFFKKMKASTKIQKSLDSLYDKGVEESNKNNYPEAIRLFSKAKEKGLSTANLYYNLGVVYIKSGNKDSACVNFLNAAKKGDDEAFKFYMKTCRTP